MTIEDLTPEQLDAAVDDTLDVVFRVLKFVWPAKEPCVRSPPIPNGWCEIWTTVRASLERHQLPPPYELMRVAAWVCCELYWREKYRALTPDEVAVRDAAVRLVDAASRLLDSRH